MIHPHTELRFISDAIGRGVVATRPIPRGTITWTLDDFDLVLPPERVAVLDPHYREIVDRYAYLAPGGSYVLCWDFGRFVNHSCDPTSHSLGPDVEIAVRDIEAGEQLTSDYGELNLEGDLECRCGARRCRGTVRREDALRLWKKWDERVGETLPFVRRVEQPLWPFVRDAARLEAILGGRLPVPSTRHHYVPETGEAAG